MGNGKNSMSLWNLDMALLNFDSGNLNDHVWIEHVVVANSGSAINTLGGKDSVTIRSFPRPICTSIWGQETIRCRSRMGW